MIITDVMMPGMEGSEAIRRLKEIKGKASVPIFFFSASLDDQRLKVLTDSGLGNRTFLKTQVTPSELTYAVNDFFKEQK